jgi:hypothetical protein
MNAIQHHRGGSARVTHSELVNNDAAVKRINRTKAMRQSGQTLRACSSHSRDRAELGAYYVLNAQGIVVATHVSLERIARDLGVLRPDDVAQSPLTMTLEQAEALLYEARERLQDAHGFAAERALRQEVEEAQTRVNLLRATQARAAA